MLTEVEVAALFARMGDGSATDADRQALAGFLGPTVDLAALIAVIQPVIENITDLFGGIVGMGDMSEFFDSMRDALAGLSEDDVQQALAEANGVK